VRKYIKKKEKKSGRVSFGEKVEEEGEEGEGAPTLQPTL
jgi:hypothetical protein